MRKRAERCRPCSDENVLGKEWLNLSALETWLALEGGGICCCSCSAPCCRVPASSRLFQTPHRGEQPAAGKGACTKLALGNLQGAVGTWDREAETHALTVGCEPWGLCCSLGPGIWDGAGSSIAVQRAGHPCVFLPAVATGCSSKTWLRLLWSSCSPPASVVVDAGNANPAPQGRPGPPQHPACIRAFPRQGPSPVPRGD